MRPSAIMPGKEGLPPKIESGIQEAAAEACKHHWVIETPNGATSIGTCKTCGDVRSFLNYFEVGKNTKENNKPKARKPEERKMKNKFA